jgi:tartrate dehydratase alpha subunit/fumarate hydratase class I-like protein
VRRRVHKLRERVAVVNNARPSWVKIVHVHSMFGDRIDVEFQWVNNGGGCLVHTSARTERAALRAVMRVADHVQQGRRFRAADPTNWEPWTR